jgi:hypothetical protein
MVVSVVLDGDPVLTVIVTARAKKPIAVMDFSSPTTWRAS